MLLLLLQNPDWTWKRLYCSCDGRRALTSVHQPKAARLFHLFRLLWFPSTMMPVSWGTEHFCEFLFFFIFSLTQVERRERHVKGDGGIVGKMKKITLDSRYCSAQGFDSSFELFKWSKCLILIFRFPVHKSSSDDGSGGKLKFSRNLNYMNHIFNASLSVQSVFSACFALSYAYRKATVEMYLCVMAAFLIFLLW